MHKSKWIAGVVAGGLLGLTAVAFSSQGGRMMMSKKMRMHGKKIMRAAKNFLPL